MGYSLYLKGKGFDRQAWIEAIESGFVDGDGSMEIGISGIGSQLAGLEDGLDQEQIWLHPLGGIRGVTVWTEEDGVRLSLPTGCSGVDYALAWELMRMGVKHGAEPGDEETRDLNLTDAQIEEVTKTHQDFEWNVLANLTERDGGASIPVGGLIHLQISPEDAVGGREKMEAALVGKMNRYSEAFVASRMQYSKNGNTFIACNYGQIPTLISEEAEMITVNGESGMIVDGMIPAAHFFSCLGDRYEDLGPMKYVPIIDFGAEPQLLESLKAGAADEPSGGSEAEGLTGEDWATLAKGPCLVFIIVAAADGKIDDKEMGLFGGILQSHEAIPSEIFSKILGIAKNNAQVFCQDILTSGVSPAIQLLDLGRLIHSGKIPKAEADLIARCLCGLGMAIASASGGFLGFGSKISKEEAAALRVLDMALLNGSGN